MIAVDQLRKTYRIAIKEPGWRNSVRHFFHREYRQVEAVRGVSFQIQPGEIVGFLGPNGAGKTTTLKMLTGLLHPSGGHARVAGHIPYRREHAFLRRITMVMGQKQQLIWDLPALDTLRLNAAVYDIPAADAAARIRELSEMLELGDKLKTPVRKLSLGERMKAELLAALLHRPEILFLDEPTLGLDVNAQAAVRAFLRDYNRQHGATILLTSHYMADITALCPRVLLIHEGSLMVDASLESIRRRFAPYREVKLELEQTANPEELRLYGELARCDGRCAELIVRQDALTETVNRLFETFAIRDVTITDPPLETVIGRLFAHGTAAEAAPP